MAFTIDVDFDVYKAVFTRRANETMTENDVLRELLGLPPRQAIDPLEPPSTNNESTSLTDWIVKGTRFPTGTEFRSSYKGRTYTGRVNDGALLVDGKSFDSPSAAAVAITSNPVNGWRFWECRLPGKSTWQLIDSLRR